MKNSLFVGIDPAFRKGKAFAVVFLERLSLNRYNMQYRTFEKFVEFVEFMYSEDAPLIEGTVINVENSNEQKILFVKTLVYAESVGKNKAISQCTVDLCKARGYVTNSISPLEKGKKIKDEKIFFATLRSDGVTCLDKKNISQDVRDAYVLARYKILYK